MNTEILRWSENKPDPLLLHGRSKRVNRPEVAGAFEGLENGGLLGEHESVGLGANLRQIPPPLEVLWIALIAKRLLCNRTFILSVYHEIERASGQCSQRKNEERRTRVVPVTFGEAYKGADALVLQVVNHGANGARLLEPVALPKLPGTNALVHARLVVVAAGHGSAVDGVHDAILAVEPHLVAPFLGSAIGCRGVVVVDQVQVSHVPVERRVQGSVRLELQVRHGEWKSVFTFQENVKKNSTCGIQ